MRAPTVNNYRVHVHCTI